ncbi:hypothetical protein LKK83_13840 [Phormidium sp. CCY1219]|nr:hypothetical protein [Phormidium sp. CCY1219]
MIKIPADYNSLFRCSGGREIQANPGGHPGRSRQGIPGWLPPGKFPAAIEPEKPR